LHESLFLCGEVYIIYIHDELEFLLPLYVFVGGLVYMLSLRFLSVLDEQDILFLRQVFGVRVGLIIGRVLYRNRPLS
jgi:hypothetical protein